MSVTYVTLDNPPANSYDLEVMQAFAADVDEAIASDARVVVVRSASEKFFSAGADVKKFLDGDVDANMEMIRTQPGAFRRMAAARAGVHRAHRRARAGRRAGDRARVRHAGRGAPGDYKLGTPEVDARAAARQRRHAAADEAPRAVAGRCDLLLTGARSGPTRRSVGPASPRCSTTPRRRRVRGEVRRRPRARDRGIKRCVHEGGQLPLDEGLALEAELMERAVPLEGRATRA